MYFFIHLMPIIIFHAIHLSDYDTPLRRSSPFSNYCHPFNATPFELSSRLSSKRPFATDIICYYGNEMPAHKINKFTDI